VLRPHTTDLQIATVGRFDHTTGIPLSHICHRASLIGVNRAAIQLDPTDTAIHCLDDTQ